MNDFVFRINTYIAANVLVFIMLKSVGVVFADVEILTGLGHELNPVTTFFRCDYLIANGVIRDVYLQGQSSLQSTVSDT